MGQELGALKSEILFLMLPSLLTVLRNLLTLYNSYQLVGFLNLNLHYTVCDILHENNISYLPEIEGLHNWGILDTCARMQFLLLKDLMKMQLIGN